MDSNDAPGELAKQTLRRLAKERLAPVPENYCRTFREVDGKRESWASFCHYTKLIEDALVDILHGCQTPDQLLDRETARIARELATLVAASSSEDDLKRVRDVAHALSMRLKRDLAASADLQTQLADLFEFAVASARQYADEPVDRQLSAANIAKVKDVLGSAIDRQNAQSKSITDSSQALKAVMSELIRQAASLVKDTAVYETKITELGEHIQDADDLAGIKAVVGELDVFVRDMGSSVRQSHDSMSVTHERLVQAEQQIVDLRQNLAATNERARRDKLTGVLNRSGLEEIWDREVKRAQEDTVALSVGLLDVDNFKLLNDRYGHTVGDEALVHLTAVVRNALHGTDRLARYGGEEFIVVLPDTDLSGAEGVMKRLQRELTKHFFLHGNDRLLITFSAGVTLVKLGKDTLISAIERADGALYEAKRQGKNRVVAA